MLRAAWLSRSFADTAVGVGVTTRSGGGILILAECHQVHELAAVFKLVRECISLSVLASLVLARIVSGMAASSRCSRSRTPVRVSRSRAMLGRSESVVVVVAVTSVVVVTLPSCRRSGSSSMYGRRILCNGRGLRHK